MMISHKQEDEIREVSKADFLNEVMTMKSQGRRLSQACAACVDGHYELTYSFADDDVCQVTHIRVKIGYDESIQSITAFYPTAVFYENEIAELHGVRIEMMEGLNYHGRLYRLNVEAPFLPKDAGKLKGTGKAASAVTAKTAAAAAPASETAPAAKPAGPAPAETGAEKKPAAAENDGRTAEVKA